MLNVPRAASLGQSRITEAELRESLKFKHARKQLGGTAEQKARYVFAIVLKLPLQRLGARCSLCSIEAPSRITTALLKKLPRLLNRDSMRSCCV